MADFTTLSDYSWVLLVFIFGYFIGRYRSRYRGAENRGEADVRYALMKFCKDNNAHLMNNITLRLEDKSTTQIDHILISKRGIFVIETKHYNWWIFANPRSKNWLLTTYTGKYNFQNPIFQNYRHVRAIQKTLDFIETQHIHNIVVFTGTAVFKNTKPHNVYYLEELIPAIEKYPDGALSLNRVQFCVGRLEYLRLALTRETDVEHQTYLTKRHGNYYNSSNGHQLP